MIAAPVKTKGEGVLCCRLLWGICVPVRRDSIEGRRLRRARARCLRIPPPPARGDSDAVLADLLRLRADLRAFAAGRGIALNAKKFPRVSCCRPRRDQA